MKGKVTCYGGGLIGSGWATTFLLNGLTTYLYDLSEDAIQTSKKMIEQNFDFLLTESVISKDIKNECMTRLNFTIIANSH